MLPGVTTTTRSLVPRNDTDVRCLVRRTRTGQLNEHGENLIAVLLNSGRSESLDVHKLVGIRGSASCDLGQGCVGCDDVCWNSVETGAFPPPILQTA